MRAAGDRPGARWPAARAAGRPPLRRSRSVRSSPPAGPRPGTLGPAPPVPGPARRGARATHDRGAVVGPTRARSRPRAPRPTAEREGTPLEHPEQSLPRRAEEADRAAPTGRRRRRPRGGSAPRGRTLACTTWRHPRAQDYSAPRPRRRPANRFHAVRRPGLGAQEFLGPRRPHVFTPRVYSARWEPPPGPRRALATG